MCGGRGTANRDRRRLEPAAAHGFPARRARRRARLAARLVAALQPRHSRRLRHHHVAATAAHHCRAGAAAATLLKELGASAQWRAVGLLDDDGQKHGAELGGVKVLGAIQEVGRIADRLGVSEAIIAMPEASHQQRQRAVDLCNRAGVSVMTVPALSDIVSGKVSVSALRAIELDDLLGRDPVQLDDAGLPRLLTGRTVLVTGAGGSIGGELCRQIARFAPGRIVLYELSEFALYAIEQDLHDRFP